MNDKTREVYKDKAEIIPKLDPFVEFPKMRVSAINRINELIEKSQPKAMKKHESDADYSIDLCPRCEAVLGSSEEEIYCPRCGQRVDRTIYEL